MRLFEKIKSRKINLTEQSFTDRQKSDMKKLLNKNFGTKEISKKTADTQKNLSKANKEVFNVTGKSAVRDAKKYASGEYSKIGGGSRIGSKSKGPGAETGAKVNLNPTSGSKSKGTTPVKVNITKPIKQSEVSKKAKVFTQKIDKKKIVKDADRLVRKAEKGDKKARKKIFKTITKRFKKLSPADQKIQLTKMADVQKKMGRTFNPKTGNFEGPDTKFQKDISKIKGSTTGKRITSGPVSVTAGPKIRKRVETIRDTRATKAGMPDPFKSTTKAQTKFDDIFKGVKKTKKFKLGGETQFDISKTKIGKIKLPPKKVSPEVQKRTFDAFKTKISDATKQTKKVDKNLDRLKQSVVKSKLKNLRPPKTPSQPETGFGGTPGSQPVGGTSGSSTSTVKQSEVSRQAKEFTKNINNKKFKNTKVKGDPLLGNFDYDEPVKKSKKTPTLDPKKKPPAPKNKIPTGQQFVNKYKKGSPMNPEISGVDFDVPKKKPPINVTGGSSGSGGGKKPPKVTYGSAPTPQGPREPRNIIKQFRKGSTGKVNVSKLAKQNKNFFKSARKITKVLPATRGITKTLAKLGPKGRAAAAITTLALASPTVRKGVGGLVKRGLTGAGLGGLVGAGAQLNKKKPVGDAVLGPKKIKTVSTSLEPSKPPKETSYSKTMKSVKPYDFTKIKQNIADKKQKAKADRKADRLARENALSASEKQRQRRGIG